MIFSCSEGKKPIIITDTGFQTDEYYERMKWFKEAKFGLFISWGPGVLTEEEQSWSRKGPRPGEGNPDSCWFGPGTVPVDIYDNLYKQFNPTEYDADKMAKLAKKVGAKYLIFIARHWDGFNNYDTQFSDYKITGLLSPYRKDITGEFVEKCRENGLKVGIYYAYGDWYHPDYYTINHHRFQQYLKNQVQELLTKYGKIDLMWFDGGKPAEHRNAEEIINMVRQLQPDIIINDRFDLVGDYTTPEYKNGDYNADRYFESCWGFGIGWSWKPKDVFRPLKWYINKLVVNIGSGGNCMFGISPNPQGWFDNPQLERLFEIGEWMDKYGFTLYGTKAGQYPPGEWGASTAKDSTVYLHVLNWKYIESLTLPILIGNILSCRLLDGGDISYNINNYKFTFNVPFKYQNPLNTVIEIKLDRKIIKVPISNTN